MTAYVAIPNGDVDPESPLTTSLITALRDNPKAITEGATGAPRVQTDAIAGDAIVANKIAAGAVDNSEIAADAVHQAEIYTLTAEASSSIAAATTSYFTMTGGMFAFGGVNVKWATQQGYANCATFNNTSSYTSPEIAITNTSAGSATATWQSRYVAASPPYDLGDGDFDFFLMACIAPNGDILETYAAADPIWFHNGRVKNPIVKKDKKTGKQYTRKRDMTGHGLTWQQAQKNRGTMNAYINAFKNAPEVFVEVTRQMKNANMAEMPHPFARRLVQEPGARVVMLDPFSTWMQDFKAMRQHQEFSISDVIEYIDFNAPESSFISPPGVVSVAARFK